MGSIIKSVSLDFNEDSFLKDYKLSPTQLLKEKIWEMKGMLNKIVKDRLEKQGNMIIHLNEEVLKLTERNDVLEKETADAVEVR